MRQVLYFGRISLLFLPPMKTVEIVESCFKPAPDGSTLKTPDILKRGEILTLEDAAAQRLLDQGYAVPADAAEAAGEAPSEEKKPRKGKKE